MGICMTIDASYAKHGFKVLRYANKKILSNGKTKVARGYASRPRYNHWPKWFVCCSRLSLSQSRIQDTHMEKKMNVVGYLADKPNWITNGKGCYRDQDFVVSMGGAYARQSRLPMVGTNLRFWYGEENNQHRQSQGNARWLESLLPL